MYGLELAYDTENEDSYENESPDVGQVALHIAALINIFTYVY